MGTALVQSGAETLIVYFIVDEMNVVIIPIKPLPFASLSIRNFVYSVLHHIGVFNEAYGDFALEEEDGREFRPSALEEEDGFLEEDGLPLENLPLVWSTTVLWQGSILL
jgi:hypothetical protein